MRVGGGVPHPHPRAQAHPSLWDQWAGKNVSLGQGNRFGKLRDVANVFLSYAEQDGTVADQIVAALRLSGIAVSPAHPPQPPAGVKTVAKELTFAKCVVVLWSEHSVQNELVRAEADYARSRDILVSAVIGKPLGVRDLWFANLTHWTGEPDSEMFLVLKRLVEARLNPPRTQSPPARSRASDVPSIFLCYRREDTQDAAGRLHDRLVDCLRRRARVHGHRQRASRD